MDLGLRGGPPSGEKALDGTHQSVEGGARVALAKVGGGEAANEAVDAKTAHGLVAETEAGVDVTSHNEVRGASGRADDRAGLINGEYAGPDSPEGLPGAAAEDAEVIGVLEVFGEHDVAVVEECSKLGNGEAPDAPRVLELVGEAGVEDEAPPGGCCGSYSLLD